MSFRNEEKDPSARRVNFDMPQSLYEELVKKSHEMRTPISRLICYALDNALASEGFNYPCDLPTNEYVEGAYVDEGSKIYRFMERTGPKGIDQLLLSRREIGVLKKETILLAVREILKRGTLVDLERPRYNPNSYPTGYKVLVPKTLRALQREEHMKRMRSRLQNMEDED